MDRFIESIDVSNFGCLINAAKNNIFISIPNVHEELSTELLNAKKRVSNIKVIVDCSENSFRNGYGNANAVDRLREAGIEVLESQNNRFSFIISDEKGYFVFLESRIFAHEDVGNNAVKMDPITRLHLISYFFSSENPDEVNEQVQKDLSESSKKIVEYLDETINDIKNPKTQITVQPINEEKFQKIKENLKKNPPLHPDLQRQINTYTAKIQFAELNFKGSNLHVKKITIPPKAMPFKDEEIKKALETKMRLFENLDSKDEFKEFFSVKDKIEDIRKKYCTPITSRKKSVISVENKQDFISEIDKTKKDIDKLNKIISQHLDAEILSSKERIQGELMRFLNENPPEEIKNYQLDLFRRKTKDIVSQILNSIKYPEPSTLIKKMSLKVNFYDLTFEDFKDDEFLKELKDRELMAEGEINDIVSFREAFEAS